MKIRMQGSSVRLRLTRSEVDRFAASGSVEEAVVFPSAVLRYRVQRASSSELTADLQGNVLTVLVPESQGDRWASTTQVGISSRSGSLEILIEKDFQCAHGEADLDAFQPGTLT